MGVQPKRSGERLYTCHSGASDSVGALARTCEIYDPDNPYIGTRVYTCWGARLLRTRELRPNSSVELQTILADAQLGCNAIFGTTKRTRSGLSEPAQSSNVAAPCFQLLPYTTDKGGLRRLLRSP